MIDRAGQFIGEFRQQLTARHLKLPRKLIDRVGANGLVELIGRDRLILSRPDPGIHLVAKSALPELVDEPSERAGAAKTCQQAAKSTGETAAAEASKKPPEPATPASGWSRPRT